LALTLLLALALGGCSGLGSLITKSPPTAYDLAAAQRFARRAGPPRGQLIVVEPTALSALDSERIVVRPTPAQAATMPAAQWEDRLPKLAQARIIESFENAHWLRKVGRPADKLATDFVLASNIRTFEISAADRSAVVEIAAKIVFERTGRIMAARVFRAVVPAPSADGAEAVRALNEAFVKVEAELVMWTARVL
jgi:cholesterol transport system auxiliary component